MNEKYVAQDIEKKWQKYWDENHTFKTEYDESKEKYYALEMFPYPSGNLHMGHVRNYSIGDVVARFKKMNGFNVLHPMGWDSFGMPAENAAIKHGIAPKTWTLDNIENMKKQQKALGLSYDWDREVATCKEDYYKWTQWFFEQFYKKGLAYKKEAKVNWCETCHTVLANEQVIDGLCWRCDNPVEKKDLSQWFLRITEYADRLLDDLDTLDGWPQRVKLMQKNWIGRSEGTEFSFDVPSINERISVYTTRVDTIYGVSYVVLAPEHPYVERLIENAPNKTDLDAFITRMRNMSDIDRTSTEAPKEGMFTGSYAVNPMSGEQVPIWIANYVLVDYGTGAVMGSPAHDERDWEFAHKYDLPIKPVVSHNGENYNFDTWEESDHEDGVLINSGEFDGQTSEEARKNITAALHERGIGEGKTNFRLRDWLISRQRYWGVPIPVVYCEKCGEQLVPEEELPVRLPEDVKFESGAVSPLATSEAFMNAKCPKCGGPARRETDTMDTFVDSSWYYLRYLNPSDKDNPFDKNDATKNTPVDQYIGGIEHAVMHLLYARFFHKVFRDLGYLDTNEPFKNLLTQGMVLDYSYYSNNERRYLFRDEVEMKDGNPISKKTGEILVSKLEKMSKSKNNGLDPESIIREYGADATRLFSLFAAPPEKELEWNMNGVVGAYRFINRIYLLVQENREILNKKYSETIVENRNKYDESLQRKTHLTIKKVTESMEDNFHFNTAIAAIMELLNELTTFKQNVLDINEKSSESDKIFKESMESIILMISPFSPHVSEELWREMGEEGYIFNASWPKFIEKLTISNEVTIAVQVNGKLRGTLVTKLDSTENEVFEKALQISNVSQFIEGKEIVKKILVKNKLLNIVVK